MKVIWKNFYGRRSNHPVRTIRKAIDPAIFLASSFSRIYTVKALLLIIISLWQLSLSGLRSSCGRLGLDQLFDVIVVRRSTEKPNARLIGKLFAGNAQEHFQGLWTVDQISPINRRSFRVQIMLWRTRIVLEPQTVCGSFFDNSMPG